MSHRQSRGEKQEGSKLHPKLVSRFANMGREYRSTDLDIVLSAEQD